MNYKNPMQNLRIEKVVVNIGVGESGEKLGKAENLLRQLTNRKPVRTISRHKIPGWGLKKGEPIGCKVTLRGKDAEEILKKGLSAKDNRLRLSNFESRNISFGIQEYIDIPGMKYDPEIGIFGMNITTTLERPGYRISRRRIRRTKIPRKIAITRQEAVQFMKEKFNVELVGD